MIIDNSEFILFCDKTQTVYLSLDQIDLYTQFKNTEYDVIICEKYEALCNGVESGRRMDITKVPVVKFINNIEKDNHASENTDNFLIYEPGANTYHLHVDQVEEWAERLSSMNHIIMYHEPDPYAKILKIIDEPNAPRVFVKIPYFHDISNDTGEINIQSNTKKSKVTIAQIIAFLCFGFIFADSLYILKTLYDTFACIVAAISVVSAFTFVIVDFMILINWANS